MWAKISNSATSMACAACIAAAATLPWTGTAAERLANEEVRLAAITDVDAFSAIPLYAALLGGDLTALSDLDGWSAIPPYLALLGGDLSAVNDLDSVNGLPALVDLLSGNIDTLFGDETNSGYDALSAVDIFFGDGADGEGGVISDGNFDGLSNYDALSALPVFRDVANAAAAGDFVSTCSTANDVTTCTDSVASALGGYDALSAVDTFFGDGPVGADEENPIGGVFTGGGIDALAPGSDDAGGYAALSALPVFFGGQNANAPFGPGVFTGGGIDALSNYDALSAIPAYLNPAPTTMAAPLAASNVAPQAQAQVLEDPGPTSTTPSTGSNAVRTFVASLPEPQFTPPAPQAITPPELPQPELQVEPQATPGDNGGPDLNVSRVSQKFTPKSFGESPILFGSGKGADNGIRGWDKALKSIGLGGGEEGGEGSTP